MVKGRVVRPLEMAGHPSKKKSREQPSSRKLRRPSDRRRSQEVVRDNNMDHDAIEVSYDRQGGGDRRYGRSRRGKSSTAITRMKTILENSMQSFKSPFRNSSSEEDLKFHQSSDSNADYMESQRNQRRRKREHRLSPQEHKWPFQIPPFANLSQRADLWIIAALTSCVSLASFAQLLTSSNEALSTTNRRFAFSTSIISFVIAFILGAAFRYAPLRHQVTRSLSIIAPPHQRLDDYQSPITTGIKQAISQSYISIELLLAFILSLFWTIAIPIIVDGFYNIGQDPLAVFGMEIWNANLFYSSWLSVILVGYIFIELITSADRYGTVPANNSRKTWKENTFSKRWLLLTFTSVVVLSSSASIYSSNLCDGELLKGTEYCRKALLGILVGGFSQLFFCCCVGVLYRLRSMDYTRSSSTYYYDSRGRRQKVNRRYTSRKMSVWQREQYSLYFGILSIVVQAVNVSLLTSPIGGGPGNSSGTLYFASWLSLFLVFEMCLRYLELHTTSAGRRVRRKSEKSEYDGDTDSEATYPSDSDDLPPEKQSSVMRILRNEDGSHSSAAPVYEEVDSYSAESPRYTIEPQATYLLPSLPPAPSPPDASNQKLVPVSANDAPTRPQIEPEEEMKVSPHSSSGDFSESIRDFSIGSRRSSPDPSAGEIQRALPPYSASETSDDISNDELFQKQVSRTQSFATQSEEELDEPRDLPQYRAVHSSRHNNSSNLSPLNESSKEGRRSSDSQFRSGSERSASRSRSRSGSRNSGSRNSGSRSSGSRRSGSEQSESQHSGSKYSSEESQENEQIPPPPVYRPSRPLRTKSQSTLSKSKSRGSKSKSRSRSGSRGKSKSSSRGSRPSINRGNPVIDTDSEDGSGVDSPPPTVSDSGKSQRSNLSDFSRSPATKSRSISTKSGKKGPPPPPFQRSEVESPQYFSDHQNRRPVTNVFTKQGDAGDDSVVSDPTLDASFHNVQASAPDQAQTSNSRTKRHQGRSNSDKDKSVTSSPGSRSSGPYRRGSSDELPPSEENSPGEGKGSGDEKVDNIVAAALAYAEKTHSTQSGQSPSRKQQQQNRLSGSSSNRRRRKSGSGPQSRASQSHTSGTSSAVGSGAVSGASLHSFYSGDKSSGKKSIEGSFGSHPTQPSVQDMVSAALAYAESTRGRGRAQQQKPKSEKSVSSKLTKSVGSMFSDSEASSGGDKSEFDC